MKKLLSLAVATLVALPALAQKPAAGDVVAEGTISSIFGNDFGITTGQQGNVLTGLRGRYFLADDLALRGTLSLGLNSDGSFTAGNLDGNEGTLDDNTFGIAFGIEKHFAGTERLSPYVGADILFRTRSVNWEINDANDAANGDVTSWDNYNGLGSTSFGIQGVVGADYYIVNNVFVGVEFGLQFLLNNEKDSEVSFRNAGSVSTDAPDGTVNLNTGYVTGLRFGFVF